MRAEEPRAGYRHSDKDMSTHRVSRALGLRLAVCIGGLLCFGGARLAAQPASPAPELVAVLPFETTTALPTEVNLATERVREELLGTGKFSTVDPQRVDKVLKDLGLQKTGCIVVKCAVEVGKKLGVRRVVTGSLTVKDTNHWVVSGYLVDVDKAQTLHASTVQTEGGSLSFISDAVAVVAARIAEVPPPSEALAEGGVSEQAAAAQVELWPAEKKATWSIAVDFPASYTFDHDKANKRVNAAGGFGQYNDTTTHNITGAGVFLISPWHVGIGYESYTIKQDITVGPQTGNNGCTPNCDGSIELTMYMVDILIDIPMRYLNLGLGYGSGEASYNILLSQQGGGGGGGGGPLPVRHANVDQIFVMLGLPLGRHFDVHLGYHLVSVEEKGIVGTGQNNGPFDTLQASGELYTLGARYNF